MNDITLQLIAQRRALGLNMSELADLPAIKQSKQVIADYESGRRQPAQSYIESMYFISTHYNLLLKLINRDIDRFNIAHPLPATDNADEYFELMKSVERLTLPYFHDFDNFVATTGNNSKNYWRIWQAVIGHLLLSSQLIRVNDQDFSSLTGFGDTQFWLDGGYDVKDLEEDE